MSSEMVLDQIIGKTVNDMPVVMAVSCDLPQSIQHILRSDRKPVRYLANALSDI